MVIQRLRTPRNVGCQSTFSLVFPLTKLSQEIIGTLATIHKKKQSESILQAYTLGIVTGDALRPRLKDYRKNADTVIFSLVH